jgi:hypothetical protein
VFAPSPVLSLHVEMLGTGSPLSVDHPRVSGLMSIAAFGFGLRTSEQTQLKLALTEEFFTFAATDVSLFTGLELEL